MNESPRIETEVMPGDLVCVASGAGQGLLSALIRWRTGSAFSHAQLVLSKGFAESLAFEVLEVGWRVRRATAGEVLLHRDFVIWRPTAAGELGDLVAWDARRLLEALERAGRTLYPWWKLLPLALGRAAALRIVRAGPRQVCSVMSMFPWIARGLDFYVWSPRILDYERIDSDAEVRTVTPGDIARNAIEQGWHRVYATSGAPVGV